MANLLYGSICLSKIPKELIQQVTCKDGVVRAFLNVKIVERKQQGQFGDTHFISCEPKPEERKEGVNYIIGDLKTATLNANANAQPQQAAPTLEDLGLPF